MGKKVLYISQAIGLGHVFRDLAIASELRKLKPDIDLYWLAEPLVTQVLTEAGEKVLPDTYTIYNKLVSELSDDKNQFSLTKMLYSWNKSQANTFQKELNLIHKENFDLVIGEETYEIATAWVHTPELIDWPFIMIWDFVKVYPMTNSLMDGITAWAINRNWDKGGKMKENPIFTNIFLGLLEDIPDENWGLFMGKAKEWGRKYCHFVGYPIPFDPQQYADQTMMKERLGYGKEPLIICTIGGTKAGWGLLNLCAKSYPLIRKEVPNVRMILVGGPSVQPGSLELPEGIEIRGYVPRLYEHLAASDLAIVLGGRGTTLELTALKRPFIYFPLEKSSEQMISTARMLARHNAGVKMLFSRTSPEVLAKEAIANIGKKVEYAEIPIDGCKKAAEIIAQRL